MPQMMPINWILSFIIFIIIFILFNILNYYIFSIKIFNKKKIKSFNSNFQLWKW
uniref:ATP synthase F0 subunit 8 n=1 Tax=Lotongus taprobanus TaxID=3043259 RepID=UPI002551E604|nr:ATP synthase F0 subunit 8 [Lotongus taprobanus]WGM81107.1 ATP synthase F0 subunit 8 [Lotongus taprobanus]